ncbi:MAG: hypothetical protein KF729_28745 [Sandaracinaceae bacterium]|nr:hypothetical protein [Sandaracinaceae bacterium]
MIPLEWLQEVIRERDGLRRLLEEAGSLSVAAHRLATAKCMTTEHSSAVPTRGEVRAAARQIASRVPGTAVPETALLVSDCEALGLAVI